MLYAGTMNVSVGDWERVFADAVVVRCVAVVWVIVSSLPSALNHRLVPGRAFVCVSPYGGVPSCFLTKPSTRDLSDARVRHDCCVLRQRIRKCSSMVSESDDRG